MIMVFKLEEQKTLFLPVWVHFHKVLVYHHFRSALPVLLYLCPIVPYPKQTKNKIDLK